MNYADALSTCNEQECCTMKGFICINLNYHHLHHFLQIVLQTEMQMLQPAVFFRWVNKVVTYRRVYECYRLWFICCSFVTKQRLMTPTRLWIKVDSHRYGVFFTLHHLHRNIWVKMKKCTNRKCCTFLMPNELQLMCKMHLSTRCLVLTVVISLYQMRSVMLSDDNLYMLHYNLSKQY